MAFNQSADENSIGCRRKINSTTESNNSDGRTRKQKSAKSNKGNRAGKLKDISIIIRNNCSKKCGRRKSRSRRAACE